MAATALKKCPHGRYCPVQNIAKHASLFFHVEEDMTMDNPGSIPLCSENSVSTLSPSLQEPSSYFSMTQEEMPGSFQRKEKRKCGNGMTCMLRSIQKHEDLFDHMDECVEEAGAGSNLCPIYVIEEENQHPGMFIAQSNQ